MPNRIVPADSETQNITDGPVGLHPVGHHMIIP